MATEIIEKVTNTPDQHKYTDQLDRIFSYKFSTTTCLCFFLISEF